MDSKKVIIRKTKGRGKGVFARTAIKRNELIASFDGEIYGRDIDWTDDLYNHAVQFEKWRWRDSKGIARLLNHSCDPNCGIHDLFNIVAMRDIMPGEELTWDYAMTENHVWRMKCKCGSPICRNIVGAYKDLPASIRKKYKGYVSAWLTK